MASYPLAFAMPAKSRPVWQLVELGGEKPACPVPARSDEFPAPRGIELVRDMTP
jgi:hypothetical protein